MFRDLFPSILLAHIPYVMYYRISNGTKGMRQMYHAINVRPFMDHQGRTVVWLSRQLGLSYGYTTQIARGDAPATQPVAKRISDLLGAPVDALFAVPDSHECVDSTSEAV